jgi:hypothetical protein
LGGVSVVVLQAVPVAEAVPPSVRSGFDAPTVNGKAVADEMPFVLTKRL